MCIRDRSAECLRADLSLPGSFGSFMAPVFLDSGSVLTPIGVGLLSRMCSSFGGAVVQIPLENGPRAARTATGSTVTVTHKTVPIEVNVRTPWGAVKVPPITFAVMPGSDDVVLLGMARHEGRSGGAARSGMREEEKQSAKGLTCHKCGEVGHIQRNCHKGRSQGSAQSSDGDTVRGGRRGARGRGK